MLLENKLGNVVGLKLVRTVMRAHKNRKLTGLVLLRSCPDQYS